MKKIFIGIAVIFVIIIGVLVYGASQSGSIIQEAVLEYAPPATGADVTLDKVNVSILGGNAGLSGLTVGNPKGFKSDYAFKVADVGVKIDMASLASDIIRIEEVRIDGADLIYEIGTKGNNISRIQKNIEAYTQSLVGESSESSGSGGEAKFIVDHIYITGTKVKLASDLLGGKGVALPLPNIHLTDIGTEEKAASAGEVGSKVFGAVNSGLSKIITKDMIKGTLSGVKKKLGDIFK